MAVYTVWGACESILILTTLSARDDFNTSGGTRPLLTLCPGFGSVERPIHSPAGAGIQGLRLVGVDVDGDDHEDFNHAVHAFGQVSPALSVSKTPIDVAAKICWLDPGTNLISWTTEVMVTPSRPLRCDIHWVAAVEAFKDCIAFGAGVHVGGKQGIDGKRNHTRMSHAF